MCHRRVEALAIPRSPDASGPQTNKARSLSAWLRQVIRAVVSLLYKPTGVSARTPAPVSRLHTSGLAGAPEGTTHCRSTDRQRQSGLTMSVTSQETQVRIVSSRSFVFGFAPTRALRQLSEYGIGLSPKS
jgi:hypothetical protein